MLESKTPESKIYYIVNPQGEDLTADYGEYLNDPYRQKRLTLFTGELSARDIMFYDDSDPEEPGYKVILRAIAVKGDNPPSEPALFTYYVADNSEDWGDITDADRTERFGDDITKIPAGIWISGVPAEIKETGSAITFADLRVYDA